MYLDLHVKYPFSLIYLQELEFSRHIFEKYSNIKFHKNPSRSRVVPSERTDRKTDRGTDITTMRDVFRNFANALKNTTLIGEKTLQLKFRITWENLYNICITSTFSGM